MSLRELQEQFIAASEELNSRRKDDPLINWEPTPKQKPFIDSILDGKVRQSWFLAANRSGKTDAGAYVGATLARFGPKDPKPLPHAGAKIQLRDRATSGWVVSRDFPASRDIVQPKYFDNGFVPPGAHLPFIPEREISEWRQTDQILKLKTGSLIGYKSCDSDVIKFAGPGKDWIQFDEEPPLPHYEESIIRVEAGRSLTVFGTCTILPPVGEKGGISWMYPKFIQPFKEGKLKDIMLFSASIYDNPHIGQREIELLESFYAPGSVARRIRIEGEWTPGLSGTVAYSSFDRYLHVKEQPEIEPRRPLCWIMDFNVDPFITLIGQKEGNLFRVMDEICLEPGNVPDMVDAFCERFHDHHGEIWIYGDATGKYRQSQTAKTSYDLVLLHLSTYGLRAKLKIPENNPQVADRVNSMNHAFRNERGEIEIEISPKCVELIADLEGVLFDKNGGIKKSKNPNDPYYRRTHASDGAGYWVSYEAPVKFLSERQARDINIRDAYYGFAGR